MRRCRAEAAQDRRNRQGKSVQLVSAAGPCFLCSAPKPKTTAIRIGCTMPSQLFRLRQKIFKDIAPFTQALMLKTSPDRFDHWSASVCRLRF